MTTVAVHCLAYGIERFFQGTCKVRAELETRESELDAVRLRLRLTDRDESMKWGVLIGLRPYDISLKRDGRLLGRASYIPFPILPDKRPDNSRVLYRDRGNQWEPTPYQSWGFLYGPSRAGT